MAGMVWRCLAWPGEAGCYGVRHDAAGWVRCGGAWRVTASFGVARRAGRRGMAWFGKPRHSALRRGSRNLARRGGTRRGLARHGNAWQAWHGAAGYPTSKARLGLAWQGMARIGSSRQARRGTAGYLSCETWHGKVWSGLARLGTARQGRLGLAGQAWAGEKPAPLIRKTSATQLSCLFLRGVWIIQGCRADNSAARPGAAPTASPASDPTTWSRGRCG